MDDVHSYYEFIVCVMLFDLRFRFDFVAPSTFFAGYYLSCLLLTCQTTFSTFFFLFCYELVMLCFMWQNRNHGWINCEFWRMRRLRGLCPLGFSKPLLIRLPQVCSVWRSNNFLSHESIMLQLWISVATFSAARLFWMCMNWGFGVSYLEVAFDLVGIDNWWTSDFCGCWK